MVKVCLKMDFRTYYLEMYIKLRTFEIETVFQIRQLMDGLNVGEIKNLSMKPFFVFMTTKFLG